MYEKHESYGVLKLSKQALQKESDMLNHATSKSESNTALHIQRQYIQAFQAAQSQQYAQICSAVQLNEYQQLQKFAERQRHLELEQIKAKEKTQESANASNAVKRRLQEVLLARQLRPSNESVSNVAIPCTNQGAISWQSGCAEFPLRKTGTTKRHRHRNQSQPNFKYSKPYNRQFRNPI